MQTPWDRRVLLRALLASAVLTLLAGLVAAATDEGGLSLAVRASRTLPAVPLACGVAAALVLGPARARGELLALAALGRSPLASAGAAAVGAGAVGLVAAALVLAPSIDVAVFYPRPPLAQTALVAEGDGFVDGRTGLRVLHDGTPVLPERPPPQQGDGLPPRARGAASLALALASLALPLAFAPSRRRRRLVVLAAVALLASLAAFQAAAVGRSPALLAAAPPLLLLGYLLGGHLLGAGGLGYRSGRWAME